MDKAEKKDFSKKVRIATAIVSITVLVILLIIYSVKVFLLIFAGVMAAVFFRSIAKAITNKTGWGTKITLPISVLGVLGIWVLLVILLKPKVSEQVDELSQQLPKAAQEVKLKMQKTQTGRFVLDHLPLNISTLGEGQKNKTSGQDNKQQSASDQKNGTSQQSQDNKQSTSGGKQKKGESVDSFVKKFFSSTLGVLGDLYVILLLGLFFTANPEPYKKGIVKLFPKRHRDRSREVIDATGITLKLWLFGKMLSMLVVAILTFIGLWIMGVPLFITLAIIAGLLSFIPNFGPLMAIVPAFLVAYIQSPSLGFYVILLYMGVQAVESNLITPFIMKKQIQIPMAMTLFSQILLALLVGGLGLIFATPIVAMFMVIIQMVYIEDTLGDRNIDVKGERLAKKKQD